MPLLRTGGGTRIKKGTFRRDLPLIEPPRPSCTVSAPEGGANPILRTLMLGTEKKENGP